MTGAALKEMMVELHREGEGPITAVRFIIPPEMDMLKPGTWEITPNEAPRSSEDQPV